MIRILRKKKRPTAETFTAIPRVRHYCQHLASDIDQYTKAVIDEVVDKDDFKQKMVDIL